jgi:D-psicose/D-tagatose/L-ribulose 3-epimerase
MKYGMNLLLWTGGVTDAHFPLLADIKKWGFDGAEIPLFDAEDSQLKRTGDELNNLGLKSTAVCICNAETNPIDASPSVRQLALDHLKQRVDWCAAIGAETLCGPFHSAIGCFQGRGRTPEEWKRGVEFFQTLGPYAKDAGVNLSIEPLNRFEIYFLNTAADSNRFVSEIGHPSIGYLYDSFHANIEETDVFQSFAANSNGVNHIHISENHRGVPGEGHVHWHDTFRAIKRSGYDGWLTIEAFGRALPELAAATCIWRDLFDSEANVAIKGLAHMKKMMAEA